MLQFDAKVTTSQVYRVAHIMIFSACASSLDQVNTNNIQFDKDLNSPSKLIQSVGIRLAYFKVQTKALGRKQKPVTKHALSLCPQANFFQFPQTITQLTLVY